MRVLIVSNFFPPFVMGGYEIGCSQMRDELRRRGHETFVLSSHHSSLLLDNDPEVKRTLSLAPIYENNMVSGLSFDIRKIVRTRSFFVNSGNITLYLKSIAEFRPDIIYIWNTIGIGGWSFMLAAQKLNIPWVMHLMDNVPSTLCVYGYGVEKLLTRSWEEWLNGRYIACSRRVLEEIINNGPDISGRTSIIPNWLSHDNLQKARFSPAREIHNQPLKLVFTGTVGRAKGVDIVINMSKILRDRGIQHTVDIFGRIEEGDLIEEVCTNALGDLIKFHGAVPHDDLVEKLREFDVFVFPTWDREPMAFAPIEAMAFGCMALITEINGNAEWFVHGVHCWKAARTSQAMADAIEKLHLNRSLLSRIASAGRSLCIGQLSISRAADEVEKLLLNCAGDTVSSRSFDPNDLVRISELSSIVENILAMSVK